MAKMQTPITLEDFDKKVLPKISLMIDGKLLNLEQKFEDLHEEIKEEIKHLPTKEEYFAREDKTMAELKKLREEVALTGHHYKKTNERVDIIDKHLGIDTSTVF